MLPNKIRIKKKKKWISKFIFGIFLKNEKSEFFTVQSII